MKYAFLIALLAAPAAAQDYIIRDSDAVPSRDQLAETILDRDLEFFDGGVSHYATDSSYAWTYAAENGGGIWTGTHAINDDATVCVTFETNVERCDMFVIAGERLVMLSSDGQRFPVREIR